MVKPSAPVICKFEFFSGVTPGPPLKGDW